MEIYTNLGNLQSQEIRFPVINKGLLILIHTFERGHSHCVGFTFYLVWLFLLWF